MTKDTERAYLRVNKYIRDFISISLRENDNAISFCTYRKEREIGIDEWERKEVSLLSFQFRWIPFGRGRT